MHLRIWAFALLVSLALAEAEVAGKGRDPEPSRRAPAAAPAPAATFAPDATGGVPDAGVDPTSAEKTDPATTASATLVGPTRGASRAERDLWLAQMVELAVMKRTLLSKARIGVAVLDTRTGESVYTRLADRRFAIASVVKLITTATALATLGPDYRFRTQFFADKLDSAGQIVRGNLYVKGGGDPTLTTAGLLKTVVDLKLLGIHTITGKIVVDDSFFDNRSLPPAFSQKNEDGAFRAPVSAASLNYNAVAARVIPTTDGNLARVVVEPQNDYVRVIADVATIASGRTRLTVTSRPDGEHTVLEAHGTIRVDAAPVVLLRRIEHPAPFLGQGLLGMLAGQGIRVQKKEVRRGVVPTSARLLVTNTSESLSVIARDLNKYSNNFMAEMLLKAIGARAAGAPGTSQKGIAAVMTFLDEVGLPRKSYRYENGSGLYDSNGFSPAQVVSVLRHAYRDFRYSADFVASLAQAGTDGTIGHRMVGAPGARFVRAKTGTLDRVSCLAGFAGTVGKPPLAFAIIVNGVPKSWRATAAARALQDELASLFVLYLDSE